jgi:hypothetical protein
MTPKPQRETHDDHLQTRIAWSLAFSSVLFLVGTTLAGFYYAVTRVGVLQDAATKHFMGVFGPPMAVMVAMVVVIVLRAAAGPIEFETPFGFKFRGASGPVVLYVLVYLANVAGMVALWKA